mgnify:CR=1 FL=1
MSLTINIYYKGENGNAKKFVKEMMESGLVKKIRNEEGNLKYEYYFPMEDDETVLLIDKWKDQNALDIHHQSKMMKEIINLREKYHLSMKIEKFNEMI